LEVEERMRLQAEQTLVEVEERVRTEMEREMRRMMEEMRSDADERARFQAEEELSRRVEEARLEVEERMRLQAAEEIRRKVEETRFKVEEETKWKLEMMRAELNDALTPEVAGAKEEEIRVAVAQADAASAAREAAAIAALQADMARLETEAAIADAAEMGRLAMRLAQAEEEARSAQEVAKAARVAEARAVLAERERSAAASKELAEAAAAERALLAASHAEEVSRLEARVAEATAAAQAAAAASDSTLEATTVTAQKEAAAEIALQAEAHAAELALARAAAEEAQALGRVHAEEAARASARAEAAAASLIAREAEVSLGVWREARVRAAAAEALARQKGRRRLLRNVLFAWLRAGSNARLQRSMNQLEAARAAVSELEARAATAEASVADAKQTSSAWEREVHAIVCSQIVEQSLAAGMEAYAATVTPKSLDSVTQEPASFLRSRFASPTRSASPCRMSRSSSTVQRLDYRNKVLVKFLVRMLEGGGRMELHWMLDALVKVYELHDEDRDRLNEALKNHLRTPLEQLVSRTTERLETLERSATQTIKTILSPPSLSDNRHLRGFDLFQSPWRSTPTANGRALSSRENSATTPLCSSAVDSFGEGD